MLIGSHNSASYTLNFNVSFWNKRNKWEWLRIGAKLSSCFSNKITKLTKNQNKTVKEQLEHGARILDIRVSFSKIFYTSHTFCCEPLSAILDQLKNYILENEGNFDEDYYIVLFVAPDFENQGTIVGRENALLDTILSSLGAVESRLRIVYKPIQIQLDYYRTITNIDTVDVIYYNVSTVAEFKKKFGETEFRDESILHCILTPPVDVGDLKDISLEKYAEELNPVGSYLLKQREAEDKMLPDGCIFDFFNRGVQL